MDYFGINSTDDLPKIREVLADQVVEATVVKPEDFTDNSVFNQTAELDTAIEAETGDYDADAIDAEDHEDNAPEQPE
jgi:segregation and condensation protein B